MTAHNPSHVQKISTGYVPRPLQLKLHSQLKRFNVLVMHRRFGKTVFCINEMIDRALRNPLKNPRYAYLAPLYGQAKRVAWDYLKMYTEKLPGATPNEADLRIDIPRPAQGDSIRFTLLGADNPASLKGIYLDGVILDEYAEMNPAAWREVIRPTLSDRKGWAIFIGTPKGRNAFWETYDGALNGFPQDDGTRYFDKEWFGALYKASETGIIDPEELDSARRTMTEEEFDQEYECSFSAGLVGAYYSKELDRAETDGRICSVPYDPALPVFTYWDLGIGDSSAIWFGQMVGPRVQWIDYIEESGIGIPDYVKRLRDRPYLYDECVLPHDAGAKELGTGKTREELIRGFGFRTRVLPRQSVDDGIQASRLLIAKSYFDIAKCARGLEALRNYQRKWDPKLNIFQSSPLHNWASHGADAFRTAAMGLRDTGYPRGRRLQAQTDNDYNPLSLSG